MDKEGLFATEVNMNVASYIKFDDISSRLLDVKPTKLAQANAIENYQDQKQVLGAPKQANGNNKQALLDTSFNLQVAFASALDKLVAPSGQQTPSLGKFKLNHLQTKNLLLNPLS